MRSRKDRGPQARYSEDMQRRLAELLKLTVEELLGRFPAAVEVLRRLGLTDCVGCAMAPFETLAEVMRNYRLEPEQVAPELLALEERCRPKRS